MSFRDQPRPQDDAKACVRRLARGDNHALIDLAYALEREGDPRGQLLDEKLLAYVDWLNSYPQDQPPDPNEAVTRWQATAVFALRLMTPVGESVAEFLDRARRTT